MLLPPALGKVTVPARPSAWHNSGMSGKTLRETIIEQMAQLRQTISDHALTDEDCHLLKANCEAMIQLLDQKCRRSAKAPTRARAK